MDKLQGTAAKRTVSIAQLYSRFGVFALLLIAVVASSFISPSFLTGRNLLNIVRQNTSLLIVACGAQLVLLCGEVDLSSGAVAACSGSLSAILMARIASLPLALLAGLGFGLLAGFVNGFVVSYFRTSSLIITITTQLILRGAIMSLTGSQPVGDVGDLALLGSGYVGVFPVSVLIMLAALALTWVILNHFRYGRLLYAVGGNKLAAREIGVNVRFVVTVAFVYQGLMAALGGIILVARLNSGQPTAAQDYEFSAITAVIIGGTSLRGGIGNIYGTVAGVLFIGVLTNIMTHIGINANFQQIIQGVIIATAVIADSQMRKVQKNGARQSVDAGETP